MLCFANALASVDLAFYVVAALAVTCLGLSKGGFAGFGLVAAPLLATVVPPLQAAAVLLPIMLVQDAISVWAFRHAWDAWNLKVLLPGALLGVCTAWLLAAHTPDAFVRLAIGATALVFVLRNWLSRSVAAGARRATAASGLFWGGIAGFAGTIAHAAGPPFQVHVLPQRLDPLVVAGTAGVFFATLNAIKLAPFFALGQLSTANLMLSVTLLPLAIATNLFGIWLVRRTPTALFYKVALILIFLVSLELIRTGVKGIVQG